MLSLCKFCSFVYFRGLLQVTKLTISQKANYVQTPNKFPVVPKDIVQLFYIYKFEGYSYAISVF